MYNTEKRTKKVIFFFFLSELFFVRVQIRMKILWFQKKDHLKESIRELLSEINGSKKGWTWLTLSAGQTLQPDVLNGTYMYQLKVKINQKSYQCPDLDWNPKHMRYKLICLW